MKPKPNATKAARAESATVHDLEFARAYVALKKTPAHRRQKCRELLHLQALLESQLRTVRSALDALSDTDRATFTSLPVTMLRQSSQGNGAAISANTIGRD
jgi:pyrimidine operon attenuation protein/uracil phosphoribosyltransferase